MSSEKDPPISDQPFRNPLDSTISDYLYVVVKHHKLIGILMVSAFLISSVVSLLLPKTYVATAVLLPPSASPSRFASLFSSADDPLSSLAGTFTANQPPAAQYVGILNSRSVADGINQKFNLKKRYGLNYIEDVYALLAQKATIGFSKKDQLISISFKEKDPQFAADMANAYVEMLNHINQKLNTTQSKHKRLFLEARLKEVRTALDKAETALKAFKKKYRIVSIEEQAIAAIEGAAEIKAEIIAAQTELAVFKEFGTEKQIEAVMLNAKIQELQQQLDALKKGRETSSMGTTMGEATSAASQPFNLYIPFDDLPDVGMQLIRLTREAKIQEKLFELLISQYEMARIEESRTINTIQTLHPAIAPEKKSGPRRRVIVVSSILIALLFSVILAFFLENIHLFRSMRINRKSTAGDL